ncbi:metallophosphoesterase [Peribacillus cavernae]|uniref:Phosphoesterase n=1 Tax=Peribacillus cavernae TaxID=1674310 RepID=A0A433HP51_9BACI|nr:metallophosphoesterase family protein [Peribacillus cavernae]MDQ0217478.1 putative phosphoesterase [Peribacillus cavernae]RUQ30079.1 metallophosphoesterase [Peribacillus cavernae]
MRLAFISDIHGNAIALDAVLKDIKEKDVNKIFVLGDLCFRGPEPKRALELVRSLNTEVIKGNADEWVLRGIEEGEVTSKAIEMMTKEREWTLSQLDAEDINYLGNLPTEINFEYKDIQIHAFHATQNNLFQVVQPFEDDSEIKQKLMVNDAADIYIYGHIHKSYIRYVDGKCIINTGSVGLPFDGLNQPSYAIIDICEDGIGIQTSIIRVDYNASNAIKQFKDSDYPDKELMIGILKNAKI